MQKTISMQKYGKYSVAARNFRQKSDRICTAGRISPYPLPNVPKNRPYSTSTQAPHWYTSLYFFRIFFCAWANASWIVLPPSQAE